MILPDVPLAPTPLNTFWCVCLYLFTILCYKNRFVNPAYLFNPKKSSRFLVFCFVLFALTVFCAGDFFHTIDFVQNTTIKQDLSEYMHFEMVYQYLAIFCGGNYWLFRLIVWGGAILLVGFVAKRLEADKGLVLFIIFIFAAVNFSGARMYLGMAIYFLGLSFIIKPTGKHSLPISYALGFLIILQAPFFHRSMYALVAATPLYFLPNFIGEKGTYYRVILFGVCGAVAVAFLSGLLYVLDFSFLDERTAGVTSHINHYLEAEEGMSTLTAMMVSPSAFLLTTTPFFAKIVNLFLITKTLSDNADKDLKIEQACFRFYFALTIASLVMGMLGGVNQFGGRIGSIALIPQVILIARLWGSGMMSFKTFKWILILGGAYTFLFVWYAWYCTWAHGTIY